jgi:transposase
MQVEGFGALDTTVINYIKELEASLKEYQNKYLAIKEQYDLLVYKRFARSAEQLIADKTQQLLFAEESKKPETVTEEVTEVKSYKRSKAGRKPIDPKIERREKIVDIAESEKTCACGAKLTRIGQETSEKLHIIPMVIYVEQTIRPKYACRECEGTENEDEPAVHIAPVPPAIIPRSIASPSLLSTITTQKFEMHLPYYRQEKQFCQIGVTISRQDMSNWQQKVYKALTVLFVLLMRAVKSGPVIQMDETRVQVIGEEGRADTQPSFIWLARGGLPGRMVAWYEYHPTRAGEHAKNLLQGYTGYLQTDGYEGYDSAVKGMSGIIHAGCMAHVRRRFFEAAKISEQGKLAEQGIGYIKKLYETERKLRAEKEDKKKTDDWFLTERRSQAGPVLEQFKEWLMKLNDEVPPRLLLGEAIGYALRQWEKLIRYLDSPHLTPDTNAAERSIRPFVQGRRNWLFCQSPDGADSSCGMFTLIETAKLNGLIPRDYLTVLFDMAPLAETPEDWEKLLPWSTFNRKN